MVQRLIFILRCDLQVDIITEKMYIYNTGTAELVAFPSWADDPEIRMMGPVCFRRKVTSVHRHSYLVSVFRADLFFTYGLNIITNLEAIYS